MGTGEFPGCRLGLRMGPKLRIASPLVNTDLYFLTVRADRAGYAAEKDEGGAKLSATECAVDDAFYDEHSQVKKLGSPLEKKARTGGGLKFEVWNELLLPRLEAAGAFEAMFFLTPS